MHVVSHPEAEQELEGAALWYEQRQPGLGDDFLDEFERTLRRIVAEPERWRKIRGDNRKLNFDRFPYAIVYSVRGDTLYIKAVMHPHRRPFYWQHHGTVVSLSCSDGVSAGRKPRMNARAWRKWCGRISFVPLGLDFLWRTPTHR